MTVPDYQNFLLPLLQLLKDGQEHSIRDIYEILANQFQLTEEDRQRQLPSGQQKTYMNRIGWAKTHLKKASLLDSPKRGKCVITDRGLELLKQNPESLNANSLKVFPEYQVFCQSTIKSDLTDVITTTIDTDRTPEEILQEAYFTFRSEIKDDILQLLKFSSPGFFEQVVVDLLVAMGYGGSRKAAGKAIGGSGDGGVDGIISEDPLGLDNIYIQAKRWESNVGRPIVPENHILPNQKIFRSEPYELSYFKPIFQSQNGKHKTDSIDAKVMSISQFFEFANELIAIFKFTEIIALQ